ncbi:MAG: radical SAM protein [Kiritimatiellae bacterium]|nr:radical SAM protein [Kiritimatiellia bacterium]
MKICFETFGCRLNKAEALQMEAEYLAKGWESTDKHKDADLFVVRGCSVTARAQRECERMIEHLRRHYPSVPIRICGCIEAEKWKFVPAALAAMSAKISAAARDTPVPVRTARAYLKVQDGCNSACTFCIVPKFRGKSSSVPFAEVMDKTSRFLDAGYREIVVTGCNLALYASDGRRLPDLLSSLAELTGERARIRLGSLEPGACAQETVQAMASHANVCRFLHISVQSGSNRILQAMRRSYGVNDVEELAKAAEKVMPSLGLGCDLMTGFPGESELDFRATKGLLKRLPFTNAHIFPYSERPGTVAAGLGGRVDKAIRSLRAHSLAELADAKRLKFAQKFFGRTVEVIVEGTRKCEGWTGEYLRCRSVGIAERRSLVKIFVTKVHHDSTLEGRIVTAK